MWLDDEEIPKDEEVTYLINPAPKDEKSEEIKEEKINQNGSDATIIFCIDISRSMSIKEQGVYRIKCV